MTIRRISQPISGASTRLEDNGGRLPFKSVDTNGKGNISKEELTNAVRLNFPTLSDLEASAIAAKAFDAGSKNGKSVNSAGWQKAERVVLREAETSIADQQRLANAPGRWAARPPAEQPVDEQLPPVQTPPTGDQSNMYQPGNDSAVAGQPPYQAPAVDPAAMGDVKAAGKAIGRGLLGFLKMLPVVGNILNGLDFVKDLGKGVATWLNPNKTAGEKLKAGADLLFHGLGMIAPQVGGAYDLAQGAARLAGAALRADQRQSTQLPPWQMDAGGYPPLAPTEDADQAPGEPSSQYPSTSTPGFNPANRPGASRNPGEDDPQLDVKGSLQGLARVGVGTLKMLPVVGNVLNGLDFVRDLGRVLKNVVTLHPLKALKAGADLLFHGAGMVVPQVGGAYDLAQGLVRLAAATPSVPSWAQPQWQPDPGSALPRFTPDNAGYPQLSAAN